MGNCKSIEERKQKSDLVVEDIQTSLYYTDRADPKRETLLRSLKNAREDNDRIRKELFECYRDS